MTVLSTSKGSTPVGEIGSIFFLTSHVSTMVLSGWDAVATMQSKKVEERHGNNFITSLVCDNGKYNSVPHGSVEGWL